MSRDKLRLDDLKEVYGGDSPMVETRHYGRPRINQGRRNFSFTSITPPQMHAALGEADLNVKGFAAVSGLREDRIVNMLRGEMPIPVWVPVLLALLTIPEARRMATTVAAALSSEEHTVPPR